MDSLLSEMAIYQAAMSLARNLGFPATSAQSSSASEPLRIAHPVS
jgi:hypothetical protein